MIKFKIPEERLINRYLTNNQRGIIVSGEDTELLGKHTFTVLNTGYAVAIVKGKKTYLHRLVFGGKPKKGFDIDHINGNKLDNRKENLREITHQANGFNTKVYKNNKSGVTGVNYNKHINKWVASISFNNKHITFGYFLDFDKAVKARQQGFKELTENLWKKANGKK